MRRRRGIYRSLCYALLLVLIPGGGILYMTYMPGKSWSGMLPPLTAEQVRLADRPEKHIAALTGIRKPFGVDA